MTTGSTYDVIIIGGGVIGCATAYHLAAEHGLRPLVIERNGIGSEASGGAAGELAAAELTEKGAHRPTEALTRFLLAGIDLHYSMAPALLEESGIDYLLTDIPMLRPAFTDEEADDLREQLAGLQSMGVDAEWMEAETVRAMGTWLADDAVGVIYSMERQIECYPFALALAQAAEKHGVEIMGGEVTGITQAGGRATGVRVGQRAIEAQSVVIANGPWSRETSEWTGIDVPVIPLRGQIVHLELPREMPAPRQAIFHASGYLLPKASGDLLAGTTMEDAGFDKRPTDTARDGIMEAVARLAPQVMDLPIRSVSACLRPYSLDDMPIVGAMPGWEGLYIATGHAFKGITLCLITGKSLAELMVNRASEFPLDPFSPARLRKLSDA